MGSVRQRNKKLETLNEKDESNEGLVVIGAGLSRTGTTSLKVKIHFIQ